MTWQLPKRSCRKIFHIRPFQLFALYAKSLLPQLLMCTQWDRYWWLLNSNSWKYFEASTFFQVECDGKEKYLNFIKNFLVASSLNYELPSKMNNRWGLKEWNLIFNCCFMNQFLGNSSELQVPQAISFLHHSSPRSIL